MIKSINTRGLQSPLPEIEAKKAIQELKNSVLEVAVDSQMAVQDLLKMADQMKLKAEVHKIYDDYFIVSIVVGSEEGYIAEINHKEGSKQKGTVLALSSDHMGEGDIELGKLLLRGFLSAVLEMERLPETIVMYNSGVKLSARSSDSLSDLGLLESQGVEILCCGTCLNHYGLIEELNVGSVTNMFTIVEKMTSAAKIIKP